jgi:hypothetical protein
MQHDRVLRPDRIRITEGSFAFIPHRFLRGGFFQECTQQELCLYLLFVMAADRNGMSWYGREKLSSLCRMPTEQVRAAMHGLGRKGLIACDGTDVQVLPLPPKPMGCQEPCHDPCAAPREGGAWSAREALHAYVTRVAGREDR